jgi:outer membrane lipoprotein SlyB
MKIRSDTKLLNAISVISMLALMPLAQAGINSTDYDSRQVRSEQTVRLGTVTSVRQVIIQGSLGIVGTGIGAMVGGLAGSTMGSGSGRVVAEITGTVAGGIAGAIAEQTMSAQTGVELIVQFDTGRLAAIVQGSEEHFQIGDRVSIIGQPGNLRVTRVNPDSAMYSPAPPAYSAPVMAGRVPPVGSAPSGSWSGSTASVTVPGSPGNFRWFCPNREKFYPITPVCESAWVKVIQ